MGSLKGIFDGAKKNIQQGKESIRKAVSRLGDQDIKADHELINENDSAYDKKWGSERNNIGMDLWGTSHYRGISNTWSLENTKIGGTESRRDYFIQTETNIGKGPLDLSTDSFVGFDRQVTGNVAWDFSDRKAGLEVGGGGTLGAESTAKGKVDLGPADVAVSATGVAGLALEGDYKLGYDDGKLRVAGKGKFSFPVGVGYGVDTTIDVAAIGEHGKDAAEWGVDKAKDVGGKAKDAGSWGVDKAKDVGGKTKDAVGWVNPFD